MKLPEDRKFIVTGGILASGVVVLSFPAMISMLTDGVLRQALSMTYPLRWSSALLLFLSGMALLVIAKTEFNRSSSSFHHNILKGITAFIVLLNLVFMPLTIHEFVDLYFKGRSQEIMQYRVYYDQFFVGPSPFFLLESLLLSISLFIQVWAPKKGNSIRDGASLIGVAVAFQFILLLLLYPFEFEVKLLLSSLHLPGFLLYFGAFLATVLTRPQSGLVSMMRKASATSRVIVTLAPVILIVPPLLDFLFFYNQDRNGSSFALYYHFHFVAMSAILAAVLVYIAYNIEKLEEIRQRKDQELKEQKALFGGVFETVPIGLVICDQYGSIQHINQTAASIWEEAKYVNQNEYGAYRARRVLDGKEISGEDWAIHRVMKTGDPVIDEELEIIGFQNTKKIILNSVVCLKNQDSGEPVYIVLNKDISELRDSESKIRELNLELENTVKERTDELQEKIKSLEIEIGKKILAQNANRELSAIYQALIDHYPRGAIFLFDWDKRYRIVGGDELKKLGYNPERDILGKTPKEVLGEASGTIIEGMVDRSLNGESHTFELERKNDSYVISMAPVRDESENVLFAIAVSQNVTDSRMYEKQILRKTNELETMLYITSHDLREPLRAIRNFSQLLVKKSGESLDESSKDYIERISKGADRLDRLIDDILQLSRAQRLSIPEEKKNPLPCIYEAMERLEQSIEESKIRIEVDEQSFEPIFIDELWITQAVFNLIGNSIKFMPNDREGIIRIYGIREEGYYGICVQDNGNGIDDSMKERVLELFQRGVDRNTPGTGAGLAIVKQVAESHGGVVHIKDAPGGGTLIELRLAEVPEEPEYEKKEKGPVHEASLR